MGMKWKRRAITAKLAFNSGRIPTADEVHDAEDRERQRRAAEDLTRRVADSPCECWFPSDVGRDGRDPWKPSLGRWRD
jgi:hypothetical protein